MQRQPEPNAEGLPSTDALNGLASDYRAFFSPEVDESLKRAALKKLFADPHFNVMDGLDVYVDDYSKPVALSAAAAAASHGFRFIRSALAENAAEPGRDGERPAQRAEDAPDAPDIVTPAVTDVDSNGSTDPGTSDSTDASGNDRTGGNESEAGGCAAAPAAAASVHPSGNRSEAERA